ncbi:hypothetical protein [Amycolatopsis anabasis]|nr:hypothetical protein [Amycolatopsis anabasis]
MVLSADGDLIDRQQVIDEWENDVPQEKTDTSEDGEDDRRPDDRLLW